LPGTNSIAYTAHPSARKDQKVLQHGLEVESVTDFTPLKYVTAPRPLKLTVRGKNVRQETAKVVFELQVPIL
jgi:hypothetical protein